MSWKTADQRQSWRERSTFGAAPNNSQPSAKMLAPTDAQVRIIREHGGLIPATRGEASKLISRLRG